MTDQEIQQLVEKYFTAEGYTFPTDFEHRYDQVSSAVCYSLIRHFRPQTCLEIGASWGGATCFIHSALQRNLQPFTFISSEKSHDLLCQTALNVLRKCGATPMLVDDITHNLYLVPANLDFVFIDTDHDEEITDWYIRNIFSRCRKGALVAIHDWAVREIDGRWIEKGECFPETKILTRLHEQGKLPLEKIYWNYTGQGGSPEASFWFYKPL